MRRVKFNANFICRTYKTEENVIVRSRLDRLDPLKFNRPENIEYRLEQKLEKQNVDTTNKLSQFMTKLSQDLNTQLSNIEQQIGKLDTKIETQVSKLDSKIDVQVLKLEQQIGKLDTKIETQVDKLDTRIDTRFVDARNDTVAVEMRLTERIKANNKEIVIK